MVDRTDHVIPAGGSPVQLWSRRGGAGRRDGIGRRDGGHDPDRSPAGSLVKARDHREVAAIFMAADFAGNTVDVAPPRPSQTSLAAEERLQQRVHMIWTRQH